MDHQLVRRYVRIVEAGSGEALGSGFRLSPRRVLTAWHVVKDLSEVNVLDKNLDKWDSTLARVVWQPETRQGKSRPELDAILLDTEPVDGLDHWTHFVEEMPQDLERLICDVVGFPGGDRKPTDREALTVSAYLFSDSRQRVQLRTHGGEPDHLHRWKGLSGSPLLQEDSRHLAGILTSGPKEFEGRKLWAVPMTALLEQPEFLEKLEEPDLAGYVRPYLASLRAHLDRHGTGGLLSQQLESWDLAWSQGGAHDLARVIGLETSLEKQTLAIRAALDLAVSRERWEVATEIYEVLRYALPVAFLSQLGKVPTNLWEEGFEVNVTTEAMIEVALASFESRPVMLRDPFEGKYSDIPKGYLNVTELLPVETSIDPDGSFKATDLVKALANRMGFPEDPENQESGHKVLAYLVRLSVTQILPDQPTLFPRSYVAAIDRKVGKSKKKWREEFCRIVNRRLMSLADSVGKVYYIADPEEEEAQIFLRELRDALPALGFVQPSCDSSPHEEDEVVERIQQAHLKYHRSKKDDK